MEYYSVCLNEKFKLEVNVNCKIHTAWIVFLTFTWSDVQASAYAELSKFE